MALGFAGPGPSAQQPTPGAGRLALEPLGKAQEAVFPYFEGWHRNGKVWLKGVFLAGKPDGKWLQLDEQGQKVADGEYRDGRLIQGAPVAVGALCESVKPE